MFLREIWSTFFFLTYEILAKKYVTNQKDIASVFTSV